MTGTDSLSAAELLSSESNVHWKDCVQAAMHEHDTAKILTLVHAAETSLLHRRMRLDSSADAVSEHHELNEASAALLKIKSEKLGWTLPLADRITP